ncbi:peptide chain release factor N(5)-glutamine methyltransferase [Shimia sp. MMG029]|uniref:peptide chain release factor N(5)-glutamine methyltransferase n=1 Tax=Shimia sp. MMG029 TaxID=3021978 RepID=UPI002FDDE30C
MSLTITDLLKQAQTSLTAGAIDSAARDARLLVAKAVDLPADRLTLEARSEATAAQQTALLGLVARRLSREPLSHILGQRAFFNHSFAVTSATLDPRPETEALVLEALKRPFKSLLDLGTGTGAIAISLLAERPEARGTATDISADALAIARQNAQSIGVADRLTLTESNWFAAIDARFDLIVSNPPYIALVEMSALAPELSYEPRIALTDETDGLTAYRAITAGAPEHLAPDGWLMVEIGWQQGPDVAALFEAADLQKVAVLPDLDGRDRVVIGQKCPQ